MDTKIIVITGASSGIGAESAKQLAAEGHKVVLAARREPELQSIAKELGNNALAVVCDVTKRGDIENLKAKALERFGAIDVWVNNAGRGISRKVLELNDAEFDEIIAVNLKSALYGMQTIIPYFQERRKGHLINVSSFLGKVPFVTFRSIYSACKAALNSMTSNLRMDLSADYPDIKVTTFMPGPVSTDFSKNALGGTPQIPGGVRLVTYQTAEEVARVMVETIKNPKPEVYTNPALGETAIKYAQDIEAFEENLKKR
jgi:short-subunit dehydrogenase